MKYVTDASGFFARSAVVYVFPHSFNLSLMKTPENWPISLPLNPTLSSDT